jgi:hypothetical protein
MSYRISAKNRKIKRILFQILSIIKFEWLNISHPLMVVVIWVLIASIWIFLNWFDTYDGVISWNGFHKILWITGYILLLLNIKILFFIFWQKTKETLKNIFSFHVKDGIVIVMLVGFWVIMSINSVFIIDNTQIFREGIVLWKGLIYVIVGYTLGIFWAFFHLYSKTKTSIYIEGSDENKELFWENISEVSKNNMKLPF